MKYKYLVQVIESHVEKCSATQKARNIGKTAKMESSEKEKITYKDGTEITTDKRLNPEKVKHKESEAEKLERRKTILQSTTSTLEEMFQDTLNMTMEELGIEGDMYFHDDVLSVGITYRRQEYDEYGNQVDSYGLYYSKDIPADGLSDEDKEYMLNQIESYFQGNRNHRTRTLYETEDYNYSFEGSKNAYYKVETEYWDEGRFNRNSKYPDRLDFYIATNSRKRRSRI